MPLRHGRWVPTIPGGEPVRLQARLLGGDVWLLAEGKAMWWAKDDEVSSLENRMPDVTFDDVLVWD